MIAELLYWATEVSYRQHTLGCFIIFCKRFVTHISNLSDEEIIDLKHAMKEMENRLAKNPNTKTQDALLVKSGLIVHMDIHQFGKNKKK